MILHLHIPRTGGSSIDAMLSAAGPLYHFRSLPEFWADLKAGRIRQPGMTGHFHHGLHEYFDDWTYVVCLREPVSRVASLFRYIRANPGHRLHDLARRHGIADIYRRHAHESRQLSNGQIRLLNPHHLAALPALRRRHLDCAMAALDDERAVFGLTEGLDDLLVRLTARLGLPRPAMTRLNATAPERLSDEDEAAIRENNALDLELYAWARAQLAERSRPDD